MTYQTKLAIVLVIFLWASAFVGIRAGLQAYSPEGLALLRYLIASFCIGVVYFQKTQKKPMRIRDICGLLSIGMIGIGLYNIALNYGELSVSSGIASFITNQSPLVTTIFAVLFLGESLSFLGVIGFVISIFGIALITLTESPGFNWNIGILYILLATFVAGCYSVLQKPFLKRYHPIQTTTYIIWGGTLFLLFYFSHLHHDLLVAPFKSTLIVIYLGIFPAAMGYVAWSYVLMNVSVSRAVSFIYFIPVVTVLLGWFFLKEIPMGVTFCGGLLAMFGVWLVNQSYSKSNKFKNHK